MNEADVIGISLALGMTAGAALWEWLRGDLFPRMWDRKNEEYEARLCELREQLDRVHGVA